MNRTPLLFLNVFIIATCGLIYELLAGTLSSYVLGDSVTQFSLIIGIYLFAMVKEKIDPKTPNKLGFEALNYFEFLLDSKDNQQFTLETDSSDLVKKMKVKGSKQNEIFYKDIVFISEQRQKAEDIAAKIKKPCQTLKVFTCHCAKSR